MKTRAIGIITVMLATIPPAPTLAQQPASDEQRSKQLAEQVDESRARVEILEMELAAEKQQLVQAVQFLKTVELPVRGSAEPEPTDEQKKRHEEFVERTRVRVKEHQEKYVEMSKELGRAKRHLAELEGKRPDIAKAPSTDRRIRAIERIIPAKPKAETACCLKAKAKASGPCEPAKSACCKAKAACCDPKSACCEATATACEPKGKVSECGKAKTAACGKPSKAGGCCEAKAKAKVAKAEPKAATK